MLTKIYDRFMTSENRVKKQKSATLKGLEFRYQYLKDQLVDAGHNVKNAESFFNNAEPLHVDNDSTYVDAAILNKDAMQMRYGLLVKEMRGLYSQIQTLKKSQ